MVRPGRAIFVHISENAKPHGGNGLSCSNCHLDAGRQANSAPLWGAYVACPQHRRKNGHVNNVAERLQGCFTFSMNGNAPPLDSKAMLALETCAYWMSTGVPADARMAGAGYLKNGVKPPQPADYARGKAVCERSCALCHGSDGQGQPVAGKNGFPPLWGPDSFNRGGDMHQLDDAAAFIEASMPLRRVGTLSDQDAWDVPMSMRARERPRDPRYNGNLAQTRKQYHDTPLSLYGTTVEGRLPGFHSATRQGSTVSSHFSCDELSVLATLALAGLWPPISF